MHDDITGDEPRPNTAAHARWQGAGLGLEGEALELYVAGGALARHRARVEVAYLALQEGVNRNAYPTVAERLAYALVIGTLDIQGLGGRRGATGAGTVRVPCLAGLGKGWKQATDGAAWTSAIEAATRQAELYLRREVSRDPEHADRGSVAIRPCPDDGDDLIVEVRLPDFYIYSRYSTADADDALAEAPTLARAAQMADYRVTVDPYTRPWLAALARAVLLHLGGERRHELPPFVQACPEDALRWAKLFAGGGE